MFSYDPKNTGQGVLMDSTTRGRSKSLGLKFLVLAETLAANERASADSHDYLENDILMMPWCAERVH